MYSAIDEQDVRFHLLHEKDDSRIGYEKICKEEGKPVPDDEIARGYEVSEGEYVYVTDEDLEAAAGETYRTIDIQDFVPWRKSIRSSSSARATSGPRRAARRRTRCSCGRWRSRGSSE